MNRFLTLMSEHILKFYSSMKLEQSQTYLLQVQVTDMKRCIISGLFIQIHVMHDHLL